MFMFNFIEFRFVYYFYEYVNSRPRHFSFKKIPIDQPLRNESLSIRIIFNGRVGALNFFRKFLTVFPCLSPLLPLRDGEQRFCCR